MTVLREDRERYLNDANFHALAHLIVLAFERHPNAAQMDAGDVTAAARCAEEILGDRRAERHQPFEPPYGVVEGVVPQATRTATCPTCRGTGGGQYNDCATCDGNGVIA